MTTWVATVGDRRLWQNPGTEKRQSHSISSRLAPTKLGDKIGRAQMMKKLKKSPKEVLAKAEDPALCTLKLL